MSPSFQVKAGPFSIEVQLDDSGIRMERTTLAGTRTESIPWEKITGATLVPPGKDDVQPDEEEERIARLFGPEALAKLHELKGKVGQIFVAYRDAKNRLQQAEIPAPLSDPSFVREFQNRLGARWLGETNDREKVAKKLHTNAGFFKSIFILVTLFGIVVAFLAVLSLGLIGPVLNLLSIQKMLLDLQDGNYTSFAYRVASYVVLFFIGYSLHRVIRIRLDAMKMGRRPRHPLLP